MKLSFRKKLFLPLLVSWLCLLAVTGVDIWRTKALRLDERVLALKMATETGISTVREFADLASKGTLPLDEAKKQALDRVRATNRRPDQESLVSRPLESLLPALRTDGKNSDVTC